MHDQSASQISGRTRAAVSAMCRALRITVLKSAGNFTQDECHDLSAEKIQRVKCFMFKRCGICACQQFSNAGAAGWVRKFPVVVNWRKRRLLRHVRSSPRKQRPVGRVGISAGAKNRLQQTTNGSEPKASPDQSRSLSRTHVRLKNGSAHTDGNRRTGICPGSWAPNRARLAAASRPALQVNAN
jgi:hypothetical protein